VQLPRTFAEALRLAADLEEQKQALLLKNQQQSTQITSMEVISAMVLLHRNLRKV